MGKLDLGLDLVDLQCRFNSIRIYGAQLYLWMRMPIPNTPNIQAELHIREVELAAVCSVQYASHRL